MAQQARPAPGPTAQEAPPSSTEKLQGAAKAQTEESVSGLDWLKRTADANIAKAFQFLSGEASLFGGDRLKSAETDTSAEYKTAFMAYFDDDDGGAYEPSAF